MIKNFSHRHYQTIKNFQINESNSTFIAEFTDQLFLNAIESQASDIHFEPRRNKMVIRFRIDGILYDVCYPAKSVIAALNNHLKVRAKLDITEKRLPQDGRLTLNLKQNHHYTLRMSTLPTLYGEKIVIRILHNEKEIFNLTALGLDKQQQKILLNAINKPQGLILITGPTGSGKTTTLYSALNLLNASTKNITTIEDPIEIELEGINQININRKIGLDVNHTLRALLRQDPDIMMVGEIRDLKTAEIVIQAAQTGHLVLSTLHTNSTIESLTRLSLMGISHLNLAESLILIVAQRLIRKSCLSCKNKPCLDCIQGFKGRTGIYEFLSMTNTIRQQLLNNETPLNITQSANVITLKQAGLKKVNAGITTLTEIKRILG